MNSSMQAIILAHLVATLGMTAVIWFVQVVHYPLFLRVGPEAFHLYEVTHQQRISFIVIPLMLTELATAVALAWWGIDGIPRGWLLGGAALVGVVWASTFLIQVPLHTRLGSGFDEDAIRLLVNTNWIRTVGWSLRAALVVWITARLMGTGSP
jgi:phage terminase large subunit-like protein